MVSKAVNWGSSGPNITNSFSSLGESLANAVTGNGGRDAARAARDQSYIDTNNARMLLIQQQQEKAAAEAEAKRLENEQFQRLDSGRRDGGQAFADEMVRNIPKPQATMDGPAIPHNKFGWYGPQPAIVDPEAQRSYDAQVENYRRMAPAMFESGKSFKDYSEGLGEGLAVPMIQNGGPDAFIRGRALKGQSVDAKDYIPGGSSSGPSSNAPVPVESFNNMPGSAAKPIFNKDKTMQLVPDPANPGTYKQVAVAGAPAAGNNQEALDAVDRATKAYSDLSNAGGIGPWYGSELGMAAGHYLRTENSKLREEYEAARNKLILMERQRLMKGQGTVSDYDAAQIANMFPKFDANDPEVGIRTLNEMSRRLHAGQALYDPKGENGPLPPEANVSSSQNTQAPVPGARLAKDGFYYLQDPSDGSWHRVVPNGGQ